MKKIILVSIFLFLAFNPNVAYCNDIEDATVYYNEAIDLYKQDEIEKSIELFQKAIELNPDFYEAHYNVSQILMSIEKNEQALKSLEKIHELKPDDTDTLYNLGRIEYKRGYLSKARSYLTKIPKNASQYASAHILIDKIEKRQQELNLESKIKDRTPVVDSLGKAKGEELAEYKGPSGVVVDNRGNIYIASFLDNLIYKISIYGQKSTFAKATIIRGPIGLALDKEGNLYSANYSANNIVKITPSGAASIFADIQKPYCIFYDEEHNRLYVTEQSTNKLIKFDL